MRTNALLSECASPEPQSSSRSLFSQFVRCRASTRRRICPHAPAIRYRRGTRRCPGNRPRPASRRYHAWRGGVYVWVPGHLHGLPTSACRVGGWSLETSPQRLVLGRRALEVISRIQFDPEHLFADPRYAAYAAAAVAAVEAGGAAPDFRGPERDSSNGKEEIAAFAISTQGLSPLAAGPGSRRCRGAFGQFLFEENLH